MDIHLHRVHILVCYYVVLMLLMLHRNIECEEQHSSNFTYFCQTGLSHIVTFYKKNMKNLQDSNFVLQLCFLLGRKAQFVDYFNGYVSIVTATPTCTHRISTSGQPLHLYCCSTSHDCFSRDVINTLHHNAAHILLQIHTFTDICP